ncbi:MAG: alpha-amylase family glycosyl hydrolase [Candidatus Sumerlaeaceae bacterium]
MHKTHQIHTRLVTIAIVALAFYANTAAFGGFVSPADWRDESIYQIITDRWDDGDSSNNSLGTTFNPSNGFNSHGGDFKGLTRRIPYLKALGVTSVWISPIPSNNNGEYHGYAADDFTTSAAHWGLVTHLQEFTAAAHASGMRVVLDVVTNHGGNLLNDNSYVAPPSAYTLTYRNAVQHKAPFNSTAYFHAQGNIGSFTDPEQILGELFGLDDLKTEDAYVRAQMAQIYSNWIALCDLDGFRIDTVKHVELAFWQNWCPLIRANAASFGKSNFFMFAEVYDGSDTFVGKYTGTKGGGAFAHDSALDYPLYFATNNVFASAGSGAQDIVNHYNSISSNYDAAAQSRLVTFLDNHDQSRFLNSAHANGNTARLEAALVFQLTSLGVPCVYYGTEQRFNGGGDPSNREDMFDGSYEQGPSLGNNFDQVTPTFRLMRHLNQFRRDYAPIRRGTLTVREVHASPDIFAYSRIFSGQEVLVAVNTSDSAQTASAWQTSWSNGTVVKDAFDAAFTAIVNASGQIIAGTALPANGYRLLMPQANVVTLDPEVTACSAAMGATLANVSTTVTLTFNRPMNQASVASALSFTPAGTAATLAWNGASDQVTITPAGGAWPGSSSLSLLIAEIALDQLGLSLRGGFEREFKTPAAPDNSGIEGTISGDSRWGSALATQTVKTQFGDNANSAPDQNSGGSEANQLFVTDTVSDLFVAVSGALELNGNALNLFFDTDGAAGGVTTLTTGSSPFLNGQSAAGTIMPTNFKTDLIVQVQLGAPQQLLTIKAYKWNTAGQLVNEATVGAVAGAAGQPTRGQTTGTIAGQSYSFRAGYDNSHTGAVGAGTGSPWTASPNGAGAASGLEIQIPKLLLGAGPYRIFTGISGSTGYWSNQFLPPMTPAGNLAWAPNFAIAGVTFVTYNPTFVPVSLTHFELY